MSRLRRCKHIENGWLAPLVTKLRLKPPSDDDRRSICESSLLWQLGAAADTNERATAPPLDPEKPGQVARPAHRRGRGVHDRVRLDRGHSAAFSDARRGCPAPDRRHDSTARGRRGAGVSGRAGDAGNAGDTGSAGRNGEIPVAQDGEIPVAQDGEIPVAQDGEIPVAQDLSPATCTRRRLRADRDSAGASGYPLSGRRHRPQRLRLQRLHAVRLRPARDRAAARCEGAVWHWKAGEAHRDRARRPHLLQHGGARCISRRDRAGRRRIRPRAQLDRCGARRASRAARTGRSDSSAHAA